MDKVRELRQRFDDGSITRKYYNTMLQCMREEEEISLPEFEEAMRYDPVRHSADKAEALEMLGLITTEEKRRIVDPAYAAKIAGIHEMMGIKPGQA